MKRLLSLAAAAVLALSLAGPVAAAHPGWAPEDGRGGAWLDGLRCDAWQNFAHAVPPAYLLYHLRLHGWTGSLDDYAALSRSAQCAWALSH